MPEPRRTQIVARFADAVRRLDEAGLLDPLREPFSHDRDVRMRYAARYYAMRIPCPFLENESCGIYEDRPLRCREFLVTSPPENCASDHPGRITRPPTPPGPWSVIYRFEDGKGDDDLRIVALVLALEFASEHADAPRPTYSAPEMFKNLLETLASDVEECEAARYGD